MQQEENLNIDLVLSEVKESETTSDIKEASNFPMKKPNNLASDSANTKLDDYMVSNDEDRIEVGHGVLQITYNPDEETIDAHIVESKQQTLQPVVQPKEEHLLFDQKQQKKMTTRKPIDKFAISRQAKKKPQWQDASTKIEDDQKSFLNLQGIGVKQNINSIKLSSPKKSENDDLAESLSQRRKLSINVDLKVSIDSRKRDTFSEQVQKDFTAMISPVKTPNETAADVNEKLQYLKQETLQSNYAQNFELLQFSKNNSSEKKVYESNGKELVKIPTQTQLDQTPFNGVRREETSRTNQFDNTNETMNQKKLFDSEQKRTNLNQFDIKIEGLPLASKESNYDKTEYRDNHTQGKVSKPTTNERIQESRQEIRQSSASGIVIEQAVSIQADENELGEISGSNSAINIHADTIRRSMGINQEDELDIGASQKDDVRLSHEFGLMAEQAKIEQRPRIQRVSPRGKLVACLNFGKAKRSSNAIKIDAASSRRHYYLDDAERNHKKNTRDKIMVQDQNQIVPSYTEIKKLSLEQINHEERLRQMLKQEETTYQQLIQREILFDDPSNNLRKQSLKQSKRGSTLQENAKKSGRNSSVLTKSKSLGDLNIKVSRSPVKKMKSLAFNDEQDRNRYASSSPMTLRIMKLLEYTYNFRIQKPKESKLAIVDPAPEVRTYNDLSKKQKIIQNRLSHATVRMQREQRIVMRRLEKDCKAMLIKNHRFDTSQPWSFEDVDLEGEQKRQPEYRRFKPKEIGRFNPELSSLISPDGKVQPYPVYFKPQKLLKKYFPKYQPSATVGTKQALSGERTINAPEKSKSPRKPDNLQGLLRVSSFNGTYQKLDHQSSREYPRIKKQDESGLLTFIQQDSREEQTSPKVNRQHLKPIYEDQARLALTMGPFIFPSHGIPELTKLQSLENQAGGGELRDSVGGSTISPPNMESATRDNQDSKPILLSDQDQKQNEETCASPYSPSQSQIPMESQKPFSIYGSDRVTPPAPNSERQNVLSFGDKELNGFFITQKEETPIAIKEEDIMESSDTKRTGLSSAQINLPQAIIITEGVNKFGESIPQFARNSSNNRASGVTASAFNPVWKMDTLNEDSETTDEPPRKIKTANPQKRRRNLKLTGKGYNRDDPSSKSGGVSTQKLPTPGGHNNGAATARFISWQLKKQNQKNREMLQSANTQKLLPNFSLAELNRKPSYRLGERPTIESKPMSAKYTNTAGRVTKQAPISSSNSILQINETSESTDIEVEKPMKAINTSDSQKDTQIQIKIISNQQSPRDQLKSHRDEIEQEMRTLFTSDLSKKALEEDLFGDMNPVQNRRRNYLSNTQSNMTFNMSNEKVVQQAQSSRGSQFRESQTFQRNEMIQEENQLFGAFNNRCVGISKRQYRLMKDHKEKEFEREIEKQITASLASRGFMDVKRLECEKIITREFGTQPRSKLSDFKTTTRSTNTWNLQESQRQKTPSKAQGMQTALLQNSKDSRSDEKNQTLNASRSHKSEREIQLNKDLSPVKSPADQMMKNPQLALIIQETDLNAVDSGEVIFQSYAVNQQQEAKQEQPVSAADLGTLEVSPLLAAEDTTPLKIKSTDEIDNSHTYIAIMNSNDPKQKIQDTEQGLDESIDKSVGFMKARMSRVKVVTSAKGVIEQKERKKVDRRSTLRTERLDGASPDAPSIAQNDSRVKPLISKHGTSTLRQVSSRNTRSKKTINLEPVQPKQHTPRILSVQNKNNRQGQTKFNIHYATVLNNRNSRIFSVQDACFMNKR